MVSVSSDEIANNRQTTEKGKNDDNSSTKEKELSDSSAEIEVPDGGYGWFVVIAFFFYNFCTWGANSGYAIYLNHYLMNNTFPGGGKLDYSAIGGLSFGAGLIFAPLILWLQDALCVQIVIGLGIVFQAVALMLAAFSTKLWHIYLTQGLLLSYGLAFIFIPSLALLPQWFRKKRAWATGIGASGSGVGGVIFELGMRRMMKIRNVKWALIVQFILCLVLNSVALALTRTTKKGRFRISKPKVNMFDRQVCTNIGVWFIMGWVGLIMFGYVVVLYSLSSFTTAMGYSSDEGSYVSCMVAVGWFFGRPVLGYICDRCGSVSVNIFVYLILAILSWAMWIPCRNLATALAFGILQGLLMGTIWTSLGAIVTRVTGLQKLRAALGIIWIPLGVFGLVSPIIGIVLRSGQGNQPGDFKRTTIFAGFGYLGGSLSLWLLRGYLVARDSKVDEAHRPVDTDELDVPVNLVEILKCSLMWRRIPNKV